MTHWAFIIAAYAIALGGTGGILAYSFAAMRKAEARAEAVTKRR
ncbi:hypothetical protein [Sphingomonas oleivorans]|nr:hypothetical protein [Sphingomonas oleivorans]